MAKKSSDTNSHCKFVHQILWVHDYSVQFSSKISNSTSSTQFNYKISKSKNFLIFSQTFISIFTVENFTNQFQLNPTLH